MFESRARANVHGNGAGHLEMAVSPGLFVFLAYRLEMISSSLDAPFPMSIVTTSMRMTGLHRRLAPF
jgi:hypothetical protein